MDIVEEYLKRLTGPSKKKAIEYDDPKKFRFSPPGLPYPPKLVKGEKSKFKHNTPDK